MEIRKAAISYVQTNSSRFITELKEFVRFRTISAQVPFAGEIRRSAAWLADHLRQIELGRVQIIPTPRHPIVYAESQHLPGRPTVLIYGHYDVQPPDPLSEWRSPPFDPVIRGGSLYGRGASDDKGQLFCHVKALESYLRTTSKLPVNVKCLFEGEEEIGSPNLIPFLARHRAMVAADVAVLSDTRILGPHRPAITYALRGALSLELELRGPEQDLHSGTFGGAIHNPIQALGEILGSLHDAHRRVAIPGFYDRVRQLSYEERAYMQRVGPADEELLRDARTKRDWGEHGYTLYERTTIRPALTINGISGGYQGSGVKAVIPSHATTKLTFRLVPDQDPHEIEQLFRQHISRITPISARSIVRTSLTARPAVLNRRHPMMRAAAVAYHKGFGIKPVFLRSGGTIPVVSALEETLGIPTVLMGFALPDDQMHAPNEKFYLPNFFKGIATSIHFLAEVGACQNQLLEARRTKVKQAPSGGHDAKRGEF